MKKTLIFMIILLALLSLYFIYNYFTKLIINAPIEINNNQIQKIPISSGFKGPNSLPSTKGPDSPPPTN